MPLIFCVSLLMFFKARQHMTPIIRPISHHQHVRYIVTSPPKYILFVRLRECILQFHPSQTWPSCSIPNHNPVRSIIHLASQDARPISDDMVGMGSSSQDHTPTGIDALQALPSTANCDLTDSKGKRRAVDVDDSHTKEEGRKGDIAGPAFKRRRLRCSTPLKLLREESPMAFKVHQHHTHLSDLTSGCSSN